MKDPVVIVAAIRTPLGGLQGPLKDFTAPQLGAHAISALLAQTGLSEVDEVVMGNVLAAGLKQAPARQAALGAKLPPSTACTTISKVCGSGLKAVMLAADQLALGHADTIIAGGMESMSNAPHMLPRSREGIRLGNTPLLDHMFTDGLEDAYEGKPMGSYAEACASHFSITREQQDAFALTSLTRAQTAIADGTFAREITPLTVITRKNELRIDKDDQPLRARPEKIPELKPVFAKDGTITAANSSSISDGAAALLLMRQSNAEKHGFMPLARITAHASHAQEPAWFTTAPIGAITKLMQKTGWSLSDVDLFEINEAFAIVTLAAMRELNLPHDKVNIHGGACALGHPIGASGARILVTLLNALARYDLQKGVASLCIGGGEAVALAVERIRA